MARLAINKSSLKHQRDQLGLFKRFLPSLDLKRQQLLTEQKKAEAEARRREEQRRIAEKHARIQEEAKRGIKEAQAKREKELEFKKQAERVEKEEQTEDIPAVKTPGVVNEQLDKTVTYMKDNHRKIAVALVAAVAILIVG